MPFCSLAPIVVTWGTQISIHPRKDTHTIYTTTISCTPIMEMIWKKMHVSPHVWILMENHAHHGKLEILCAHKNQTNLWINNVALHDVGATMSSMFGPKEQTPHTCLLNPKLAVIFSKGVKLEQWLSFSQWVNAISFSIQLAILSAFDLMRNNGKFVVCCIHHNLEVNIDILKSFYNSSILYHSYASCEYIFPFSFLHL